MSELNPKQIVAELNKHIVGQRAAKRAVAIALRNRWRRLQLGEELRNEITPKNILMIGPTGVGKTEISRRLAKLANAPFIKVEATKFTEVGYVGKEVDTIIRDLTDVAVKQTRESAMENVREQAEIGAEERILDALLPAPGFDNTDDNRSGNTTREKFRHKLRGGELEDREIEIEISGISVGVEIMAPPGMEEMTNQLQSMFQSLSNKKKSTKRLKVSDARQLLRDDEAAKLINEEEIKLQALENVEQNGIVFIDEIDKVTKGGHSGPDISREGVQRDLLPLVEGCSVNTRYGMVKTDHVLFIASGAFLLSKPSDLIPELQGRLPIRVELDPLKAEDFVRILTEPDASLTEQYAALMATEGVDIKFSKEGVRRIAEIAYSVNERIENIGARRLHTVMERLLEDVSFEASDMSGALVSVDNAFVDSNLSEFAEDEDLSRYIL